MKWKRVLKGIGVAGALWLCCSCVKTITTPLNPLSGDQQAEVQQPELTFDQHYAAALKGVADSRYRVAQMLLFGDGVPVNTAEGLQWLEKAADQNHPPAVRDLGLYLLNGEFERPRDPQRGAGLLARAAAGGDGLSMMTVGYLYLTGYGVARDPQTAAYWYGQAALSGEAVPQALQDEGFLAQAKTPPPFDAKTEYRARVKRAQTALKGLGYYKSAIDGIVGPGTLAAVKEFQKDRQLAVDGRIDGSLMRQLYRHVVLDPIARQL